MKKLLYLINQKDSNHYKIGISSDVENRLKQIQTQNSNLLKIHKTYLLELNPIHVERSIHRHFEHKLRNGEWFNLLERDVDSIPELIEFFGNETPKDSRPQLSSWRRSPYRLPTQEIIQRYEKIYDDYYNNPDRPDKNPYGSVRNMACEMIGVASGPLGKLISINKYCPELLEPINLAEITTEEAYKRAIKIKKTSMSEDDN